MRLATIQTQAGPRAAALVGMHYVDLHATDPGLPAGVRQLLEAGPTAWRAVDQAVRRDNAVRYEAAGVKLLAPVPDPHNLPIRLRLNGQTMQDSNTKQMVFNVGELLAYLSQVFTLQPGDLIFTGTPPGVGFARKPPVFLKAGDVAEVEIEGLGVLRN